MMRNYSDYEEIEVSGRSVVGFVQGFAAFKTLATRYLLEEGVGELGPDEVIRVEAEDWYPLAGFLRAFERVAAGTGDLLVHRLGMAVMQSVYWPPEANTLPGMVQLIDTGYHLHHRRHGQVLFDVETGTKHEGIGRYVGERESDEVFVVRCENPYLCAFDRGLVEGALLRLGDRAGHSKVVHDDSEPCRAKGGISCTLRIVPRG